MSDTDDTDVLLLIPPDFFLVHSDSDESYNEKSHEFCDPHSSVVGTLVTQVHNIENRLNRIENTSQLSPFNSLDSSCNSTIIPMSEMSGNGYRHHQNDNYIPTSAKSTPQKPKQRWTLTSLPSTPSTDKTSPYRHRRTYQHFYNNVSPPIRVVQGGNIPLVPSQVHRSTDADESSFNTTPEKISNKQILGEIDHFLTNVKTIQKSAQKNLNPAFNAQEITNTKVISQIRDESLISFEDLNKYPEDITRKVNRLNLKDVDRLLQSMENQQRRMSDSQKVESLYRNDHFQKERRKWEPGDNKNSVPDLGFGMRDNMYPNNNPETLISKTTINKLESAQSDSTSSSENTNPTVLERKRTSNNKFSQGQTQTFEQVSSGENLNSDLKNDADGNGGQSDNTVVVTPQKSVDLHKFTSTSMSGLNLFSLADIWKNNSPINEKELKLLRPKLEEEKCRRKHCEKLIQELHIKILEMQQRLAVAIQVDAAKDEAILRFHEAWEKVAERWKGLEAERNSLSEKLNAVEKRKTQDFACVSQKILEYEDEIKKALELAKIHSEKCKQLDEEKLELFQQIGDLQSEIKVSQEKVHIAIRQRDDLSVKFDNLEKESVKDKHQLLDAEKEIAQSKHVFAACQNELKSIKDEYFKLQKQIQEEQKLINELQHHKMDLEGSMESYKKNEVQYQEEMKKIKENSEKTKYELRNFYQQQVELLVKEKLKEFQGQLEQVEKSLQEELHTREQTIAKVAAKQMQKLSDKHSIEVKLLEGKHKEEIHLYELQYNQMKEQMQMMQSKLESYQARHTNIAKELHNVMEAQWVEALRILNNGKSPFLESPVPAEKNSENLTTYAISELRKIMKEKPNGIVELEHQNTTVSNNNDTKLSQFKSNQQASYKIKEIPQSSVIVDTPVTSKPKKPESSKESDSDLQKYVKLLLDNLPRSRMQTSKSPPSQNSPSELIGILTSLPDMDSGRKFDQSGIPIGKENRSGKPPWK